MTSVKRGFVTQPLTAAQSDCAISTNADRIAGKGSELIGKTCGEKSFLREVDVGDQDAMIVDGKGHA
jgi:hypothetical protein